MAQACRSVHVPLGINKPFECRSAVLPSPSFRPMSEGYIDCSAGPPSMRQRGKPRVGIGGSMATLDLTDVRPNRDSLVEDSLSTPVEDWAPPLAPFGEEDGFLAPEPSRGKLIASIAIVAALGAAVLAYFFLAWPGAKSPADTAQTSSVASSPTGEGSSSETQVPPAPTVAEPSPGASGVVPSPDVSASLTAAASPQVGAVTPQTNSAAQKADLVFLQRPGVNIRSGPSV